MLRKRLVVGHYGIPKYVIAPVREALQNQSAFLVIKSAHELIRRIPADLLLYASQETAQYDIRLFKRLKLANPALPVLLIESRPDALRLVQLLRSGADDFLCPTSDSYALQGKIRKLLASTQGQLDLVDEVRPTQISAPASEYTTPPSMNQNRRRCFRARVGQNFAGRVYFLHDAHAPPLHIEDLSILTDGEPGGMLLTLPEDEANTFSAQLDDQPNALKILVDLSKKLGITQASAKIIRTFRHGEKTKVALQYVPESFSDERRFQRFWVACQQLQRQRELTLNHYMNI